MSNHPGLLPAEGKEQSTTTLRGAVPPLIREAEKDCEYTGPLPPLLNCGPPPSTPPLPTEVLRSRFSSELSPELGRLEKTRRTFFLWAALIGLWGLLFAALVLSAPVILIDLQALQFEQRPLFMLLGGLLVAFILFIYMGSSLFDRARKCRSDFEKAYKQLILPQAVRLLNPSFEYRPEGISFQRFSEGRLFLSPVHSYHSEDYFCGRFGATAFEFAEVTTARQTKDVHGDTAYAAVFRGIYFIADFNKHFRTRTLVVPATREKKRGPRQMDLSRGEVVSLEDPEFEKAFDVFADDQVEARYILTPALMERILALKRGRGEVSFSFLNEQVHIALSQQRDLFEPSVFTPVTNTVQVEAFLYDLRSIIGIINMLNLNTRIWSKS